MAKETLDLLKAEAAKTRASLQKIREDIARIAGGIVPSGGLTEEEALDLKADLEGLAGEAAGLDAENPEPEEPEG